jgi:hypothetical protein
MKSAVKRTVRGMVKKTAFVSGLIEGRFGLGSAETGSSNGRANCVQQAT